MCKSFLNTLKLILTYNIFIKVIILIKTRNKVINNILYIAKDLYRYLELRTLNSYKDILYIII